MDLQKVAEGDGLAVYQAVRRVQGKPRVDPDGAVIDENFGVDLPAQFETFPAEEIAEALAPFGGSVRSVSWSSDAGVSVRVEVKPAAPCPNCGEPVEALDRFCRHCGQNQEGA